MGKFICGVLSACLCIMYAGVSLSHDFILDPGHSPQKPGTMSCSGKYEYHYNEALVRYVYTYLYTVRKISVDVTRNPGEDVSLQRRAEKAKGKKVFISMHHDSAQPKYIVKLRGHPCSDSVRGYSVFVSAKNKHYDQSLRYAKYLARLLYERGLRPSTHHGENIKGENRTLLDAKYGVYQFDDLIVLKNSEAPALLLEAAVIINPKDDELAQNKEFKQIIAESIADTLEYIGGERRQMSAPSEFEGQLRTIDH